MFFIVFLGRKKSKSKNSEQKNNSKSNVFIKFDRQLVEYKFDAIYFK
jgi:hypothetical protein